MNKYPALLSYPKLTIVTPSFNLASYLEITIKSIVSQNYPNLEYIIIDGGSTDGSVDIIKKYEKYLTYWESEKDGGMYDALNKGFARSTGDIMGWVNADDMLIPNSLFTLAQVFSFPEINWFCGAPSLINQNNQIIKVYEARRASKYHIFLNKMNKIYLQQESTYWRRETWEKMGVFDTQYKYAGDFYLWMKFFRDEKLYVGDLPIGCARKHSSEQLSVKFKDEYQQEVKNIIEHEIKLLSTSEIKNLSKLKRLYSLKALLSRLKIWKIDEMIFDLYDFPPVINFIQGSLKLVNYRDYCRNI